MSASIFFFSAITTIVLATTIALLHEMLNNERLTSVLTVVGAIVVLTLFGCAFRFSSFSHMMASMTYDHVVYVEWATHDSKPIVEIDPAKVVYQNETIYGNRLFSYVIMAWDDDNETNRYEQLVNN